MEIVSDGLTKRSNGIFIGTIGVDLSHDTLNSLLLCIVAIVSRYFSLLYLSSVLDLFEDPSMY